MIYTKFLIHGSLVSDVRNSIISKVASDLSSASNFVLNLNNYAGYNTGQYNVGDSIEIYAEKDVNPPTIKIFNGIIEDIRYSGENVNESIELSGRDYSLRMMDRTVEPEVYSSLPTGSIVKDIINKYTNGITTNNVLIESGSISKVVFNHTPVYDAIKQLADMSESVFYVDTDNDLHYGPKSSNSTGYTLDNSNILEGNFKEQRDTMFNQIWVYGDRYLDGYKETFTYSGLVSQGSQLILNYRPSNTQVTVSGAILQPGGILNMANTTGSDVKYLVDYDNKKIIFTSGNVPSSGNQIIVDYKRDLPIVKVGDDLISQGQYGKKVKVIVDKGIKDPLNAELLMNSELSNSSMPSKEGNLLIDGIVDITPGYTTQVNLPNHDIINQTFDVIECNYNINKEDCLHDHILKVKLNKKIPLFEDKIKQIILDLKKLQSSDISDADLMTRYFSNNGSIGIRSSGCQIYSLPINDTFMTGHPFNGVDGIINPLIGSVISGTDNFTFVTGCGFGYNRAASFGSPAFIWMLSGNGLMSNFNSGNSYSVSFWYKTNYTNTTDSCIMEKWAGAGPYPFIFRENANTSRLRFGIYDGTNNPNITTNGSYNDGNWHHIVGLKDFSNDKILMYIDNNFIGSTADNTTGSLDINSPLYIGRRGGATPYYWSGCVCNLRIYQEKVLTSGEISNIYNFEKYNGISGADVTDRLFAYYKLCEGAGSIVYNSISYDMPTDDAIAHWNFNISGTSFIDVVSGIIGSNNVSATYTDGMYYNGSALYLSGVNSVLASNNILRFNSGNSFTICSWVNILSGILPTGYSAGIIGKGNTSACNYALDINSGTTPIFRFGERSGAQTIGFIPTIGYPMNTWHHVAGVYDSSNYMNNLYVNGSFYSNKSTGGSAFNDLGSFGFGRAININGNVGSHLIYLIDDARVYNRALGSTEIKRLFDGKTIQPILGDRRSSPILIYSGAYGG